MGFWIFMCVTVLLIPFLMISFGGLFSRSAPKEINSAFGYRTSMSMKNADTWQFAHHFWENLAYPWLDSDHTFCHSNAFCNWKRQ